MSRPSLIAAALASPLGLGASVAHAQVYVQVAPPAPVYEAAPPARPGYVWVPGHHEWRGDHYAWVSGRWMADRPGYEYVQPRWVQRGNGQWYMVGNNWERRGAYGDRDRDGVPNRYDADNRRFGPYGDLDRDGIQNRRDRDRDGDGIRNNRDRFPDNWRRS